MSWIWTYFGSLGLVLVVAGFCEKSAAMRGTKGTPLWWPIDKALRVLFFFVFFAPIVMVRPYILGPVCLLYLPSYLDGTEKKCGRPNVAVLKWRLWGCMKRRFNGTLVTETKLDAKQQYIFGLHPHGILPLGGLINMGVDKFSVIPEVAHNIRTLAASFCFYIPGYRDLCLAAGVCDASRYSARKILTSGHSLLLVPGGATEALYAQVGENVVYLKSRRGFVRLALQTGSHLVPIYSFGETDTWATISTKNKIATWIKVRFQKIFGMSLPFVKNIIPRKCNVTTVIGEPIPVKKAGEKPSDEEVQALLDRYTKALVALYNKYEDKYAKDRKVDGLRVV